MKNEEIKRIIDVYTVNPHYTLYAPNIVEGFEELLRLREFVDKVANSNYGAVKHIEEAQQLKEERR